jgi:hypothetical protein
MGRGSSNLEILHLGLRSFFFKGRRGNPGRVFLFVAFGLAMVDGSPITAAVGRVTFVEALSQLVEASILALVGAILSGSSAAIRLLTFDAVKAARMSLCVNSSRDLLPSAH